MHNGYVNGHGQAVVLGIDLGTSGVKVLVTSPDGDVLGRAIAGYPVSVPAPGQAEADPCDWWAATRRAVHAALAEAGELRLTVTGLAVVGQMHGVVLVDDHAHTLADALPAWLADPDRLARLGARARQLTVDRYDWERVVDGLEAVCREVYSTP